MRPISDSSSNKLILDRTLSSTSTSASSSTRPSSLDSDPGLTLNIPTTRHNTSVSATIAETPESLMPNASIEDCFYECDFTKQENVEAYIERYLFPRLDAQPNFRFEGSTLFLQTSLELAHLTKLVDEILGAENKASIEEVATGEIKYFSQKAPPLKRTF